MPPITRILQVHTRYRQVGGEDQVVAAEARLLAGAGIEVRQVIFDNADLRESRSPTGDLGLAVGSIWSRAARARVAAELEDFRPQAMHVHNTFAAASPSIYAAAGSAGVPVVQTLHNYRLVCPSATAFRDGRACTDCVGRLIPLPGVVHRCVRGSLAQSATVAAMLVTHRALGTWRRRIAQYIALTAFQRQLLVSGGLPGAGSGSSRTSWSRIPAPERVSDPGCCSSAASRSRRGLDPSWTPPDGCRARFGWRGPAARGPVAAAAERGTIEYLGLLDGGAVVRHMQSAVAVVLPSINFEGFPVTLVEAFATGTPVIASQVGSLAELVDDGITGLLAEPGDSASLAERMRWAIEHPRRCRRWVTGRGRATRRPIRRRPSAGAACGLRCGRRHGTFGR